MGQSTNGILFYGFPIDDESEDHELIQKLTSESEDEDESALEPCDVVSKMYGWDGKNPQYGFEWEEEHPSPITIDIHCSCDCSMYYVAIKASAVTAYRGYPQKVNPVTQPEWDDVLRDFCTRSGISVPEELGWYLVSLWC